MKRIMLVATAVALALAVTPAAAESQGGLTLSSNSVAQGERVTARSSGWAPGAAVEVSLDGGSALSEVPADANGQVETSVVVPATASAGRHDISTTGPAPGINVQNFVSAAIRVTLREDLSLSDESVRRGASIITRSAGWAPGAIVRFGVVNVPGQPVTAVADTEGQITTAVRVPPGAPPGQRFVSATGQAPGINSTLYITRAIEVTPDSAGDLTMGLLLFAVAVLLGLGAAVVKHLRWVP